MKRRDAIKIMGATVLGAIASTSAASLLTSCAPKRRKRIIFYFTATGNSLYIAKELGDEQTELLSIPQVMKEQRLVFDADEIGIVYPIYGHMPPRMVREFIKHATLNADYKFAVLTYGNRKCSAVEIWDDVAQKVGKRFDYIATIVMVDNWLPNFDMNEQVKIDKHIPENLARIKSDLAERRQWHEPVSELEREQHQGFLDRSGVDSNVGFLKRSEQSFVITERCIGCGACVDVCPRGNFSMTSAGVKTQGDCEFCFACIQNCPQHAIQFATDSGDPLLARGEKNPNARYRNEHISLWEIKSANRQR